MNSGSTTTREQTLAERARKRAVKAAEKKVVADKLKDEGNVHFRNGRYEKSIECYRAAANAYGKHPVYMSNIAAAFLKLEEFAKAEDAAEIALQYDPKNTKARFRRALARKGLRVYKAALTDLKTVLTHSPTCEEARIEMKKIIDLATSQGGGEMIDGYTTSDEDRPHFYDREAELEIESDSSDFNHRGNGRPCKLYNHEGCSKGDACDYSRAQDLKSVRDHLGKNVCASFLFGLCKLKAADCVYSHSLENVPGPWRERKKASMVQMAATMGTATAETAERMIQNFVLASRQCILGRELSQGISNGKTPKAKGRGQRR
ncbi:hypothetical protein HGRIS_006156 [Hohenbuehelia grisea]|uniref:Uncharacterized protein n=1 Tax=Hohenbuehelia grisea TaxID=104357 RepID=A0ABR3K0L5_9AGAR